MPCLSRSAAKEKNNGFEKVKTLAGPRDAVLLADGAGNIVFAKNEHTLLAPASILKLVTTLAVLDVLGEDFRFKTEFYMDRSGNLKIKGYGDPLLVSKEIEEISKTLSLQVREFKDLILDPSYFEEPLVMPGVSCSMQPYDSPNGALCANFNTVTFKKQQGRFLSDDPKTPLLPMMVPRIQQSGLNEGRILIANENEKCLIYAGELFLYHLKAHHVLSTDSVKIGNVNPVADRLIYTHHSRTPLTPILQDLLKYSSNFIANQLLLTASALASSEPGNLEKGVSLLKSYAQKELQENNIIIQEGSGISRENLVTAAFMLKVLNRFYPYRNLMRREGNLYFKTGTLTGVRSRAGYIEHKNGEHFRFVIIRNSPGKSDKDLLNPLVEAVESL